ncbi:MAG: hypothetical protein A3F47_02300 [Candidatus Staskawiczbacteria bacterium RIFCSPHIGHO2_12_FULL_38_11]|uniref:DUF5667 domain-containing protein n=1 Tax=Candidatus Staskawiczbacteria bacterium RIFCSPHIGHO2_12_FULL_38_11 TaxID=1802209 RepID=A0A1G2I5A1_9BACT|nr:MAG: hypothetical protein A3F47_02300 [Candidatus Staskawiczbacteria bacterium RIFCSPHIGHO2_12_FULL_38_11]
MTEQELISRLQSLKQIKPRENWVVFAKTKIFDAPVYAKYANIKTARNSVFSDTLASIFQKKVAYAFAAFLFVVAGMFGFMKYGFFNNPANVQVAQVSQEHLTAIKSNVEEFKTKSKILSQMTKSSDLKEIALAVKEIKDVAKELTEAIKNDSQLAKEVALDINNNKTYLDIEGEGDLKETSDILYKTIDEQMIKDLEGATLTESQQEALKIAKKLYDEGKYSNALESILLLNMAMKGN